MNTTNSQKQLYGLLGYPLIHSSMKNSLQKTYLPNTLILK